MLNFKKLMLTICGATLALSAMVSASAASNADISSGSYADATYTSIKVSVSGIADGTDTSATTFTQNGQVSIKVDKGAFSSVFGNPLGNAGLHYKAGPLVKEPNWNIAINTTASDEYDIINVGWYGENYLFTPTGDIIEVFLEYAAGSSKPDVTMTVMDSSYITTSSNDGSNKVPTAALEENKNTYTLASNGTVTKTEPSSGPSKDVKVVDYFTGDKEAEDDNLDTTDTAAAVYAQLIPADAETVYTKVNWDVRTDAENGTYTQIVNVSGEAAYQFGLVIRGLAANVVTFVDAALAQ